MDPDYLPPATSNVWQLQQGMLTDTYAITNPEGWQALIRQAHESREQLASSRVEIRALEVFAVGLAVVLAFVVVAHVRLRGKVRQLRPA